MRFSDGIHIIEYNYFINSDNNQSKFHIFGFSELDKNFELKYAIYGHDGFYYCNSNIIIPEHLRNKISEVLLNYPSDTTFLSPQKYRIYDGNYYQIIIKKNDKDKTFIKFEPKFLPNDLQIFYYYLYGDHQKSIPKHGFGELFKELEYQIGK